MKQSFFAAAAVVVLLAACTPPFKKTTDGIEYKIISDGKGKAVKPGWYFEIAFDQAYKGNNKDTALFSSKDFANQLVALDSNAIPPVYYKIFSQVRKGDSLVIKQLTDSIMKRGGTPPFMKKGGYIIAHYKVVEIYETRTAADSAYKAQMEIAKAKDSVKAIDQAKKDDKAIADYLAKNKIQATKAPKGTYVQVIAPGEGDVVDTSKVLKVFYTGKSLEDGKVFDSNTDPKFGHTEAYPVSLKGRGVIPGWIDGLSLLKKGSRAVLYIPSGLAYGSRGSEPEIKPNANLLFEVEISDVLTEEQAKAEADAKRKEQEAQRKHMMDSIQKVEKLHDTAAKKK